MNDEPLTVECNIHGRTEAVEKRLDVPGWPEVTINKCLLCEYPPLSKVMIIGVSS